MACNMDLQLTWESLRRIRTVDVDKQVSTSHEVHIQIRVLSILDEPAMRALLRQVLKESGWTENQDGTLSQKIEGGVATLSPDATEVSLALQKSSLIRVSTKVEAKGRTSQEELQKAGRKNKDVQEASQKEEERLTKEATQELSALEPLLRSKIQAALNQTYKKALEQKAQQMGKLESLQEKQEADGSYEVAVVVKA